MIEGIGFYKNKNPSCTLCLRVLKIRHRSTRGYVEAVVSWYNLKTGTYWGNNFKLPRNFKIEYLERWDRFSPPWFDKLGFLKNEHNYI